VGSGEGGGGVAVAVGGDQVRDIALIEALAQAPRTFRARSRSTLRAGERHGVAKLQVSGWCRVRVRGKHLHRAGDRSLTGAFMCLRGASPFSCCCGGLGIRTHSRADVRSCRIKCTSVMSGLGGLQRRCRASTLAGVGGARMRIWSVRRDSRATIWRPGRVAWGRSLGCWPICATAAVKLGGCPFGRASPRARVARRPPEEWRRARRRSGLAGIRERTSCSAAASVGRWDILPGQPRVPPYVAHRRFVRRLSVPSG
jgi:hypothetical protein